MEPRRVRREAARRAKKEGTKTIDDLPLPSDPIRGSRKRRRDKLAYVFTLLGLAAAFSSWTYSVINPSPSRYLGSVLLVISLACCSIAFWEYFEWGLRVKIPVLIVSLVALGILGLRWVAFETRPSFTFMVPGVVFVPNTWDFIVNHRGPKCSNSVQILFTDKDRASAISNSHPQVVTPEDIGSYTRLLKYDQVCPNGHGQIFALQFQWTPLNLDHEHYSMEITDSSHGGIHEELQVERVNGKWFWATQITDSENKRTLLACKDPGFPYGEKSPVACFPKFTQGGY